MRETCLYCEQEGVVTTLVIINYHWRACPLHSPEFVRRAYPPITEILARYGIDPSSSIERDRKRIAKINEYRANQGGGTY